MEIKVNEKYEYSKEIVKVIMFNDDYVVIEDENDMLEVWGVDFFMKECRPHDQFKWLKPTNITIAFGNYSMVVRPEDMKSHELKLNYDRYHEQCDNVEFEDNDLVWFIDNGKFINDKFIIDEWSFRDLPILVLSFSSEEHAETFLKLAKENDCL